MIFREKLNWLLDCVEMQFDRVHSFRFKGSVQFEEFFCGFTAWGFGLVVKVWDLLQT